jgi:hypothetical protein
MAHEAGKGDMYRAVDQKKFDENFDRIFGKKKSRMDIVGQNGNDGLHYEYELDKSTGEVVKKYVTT